MRRFVVSILVLLLVACGGGLSEAKSDFKKGRYAEAKQMLVRVEPESKTWDDKRRAEYALYRGLTHNALGDRAAAGTWLNEAKALEDARPGTLTEDDQVRLRLGLEAVQPDSVAPSP
jgi:hypothetical protein